MDQFTVRAGEALKDDFDAEERFARFPPEFTMKGLFFPRLVLMLGDGWSKLEPTLKQPPRLGKYFPFSDYPQVDYSRLTHAVAKKCFPRLPLREAARRVAQRDFEVFADSTVGGVMLSMLGGVESALLKFPQMFGIVLSGGTLKGAKIEERLVRLEWENFLGWVDCYSIGTVEGIVKHFGHSPHIEVKIPKYGYATYDIRWS
ncbi:MAG TPA: DUF2378 family protein [Polyangiaceae bacterium]